MLQIHNYIFTFSKQTFNASLDFATVHNFMKYINVIDSCQAQLPCNILTQTAGATRFCGGLQQYMWLCKLQSMFLVQHENKVLNPGLSVQQIETDLEICLYGLQNHRVGSKNPEFHDIILSH